MNRATVFFVFACLFLARAGDAQTWRAVQLPPPNVSATRNASVQLLENGDFLFIYSVPGERPSSTVYRPGTGYINHYQPPSGREQRLEVYGIDTTGRYIGQVTNSNGITIGFGRRLNDGTFESFGGWVSSGAAAFNDHGQFVSQRNIVGPWYSLFQVGPNQSPIELAYAGEENEYATAIDNNGVMGGQVDWSGPIPGAGTLVGAVPILWNSNGSIRTILSSPGMVRGAVTDINRVGDVAGLVQKGGTQAGWYATIWDVNSGAVKREAFLGSHVNLSNNFLDSSSYRINDRGEGIIQDQNNLRTGRWFWSAMTGSVPMPLQVQGLPTGAYLSYLTDFSNDGRIAGEIYDANNRPLQGYYLELVPEPASVFALAAGFGWLMRRRRRA